MPGNSYFVSARPLGERFTNRCKHRHGTAVEAGKCAGQRRATIVVELRDDSREIVITPAPASSADSTARCRLDGSSQHGARLMGLSLAIA